MVERGNFGPVVVTADCQYQGQCGYYDADEGKHAKVILRSHPDGPPDGPVIVVEHGEMMVDLTSRNGPAKPVEDVLDAAAEPEKGSFEALGLKCVKLPGDVIDLTDHDEQAAEVRHAGLMPVSIEILEDWLDLPAGVRLSCILPGGHHCNLPNGVAVLYLVDETGNWFPQQAEGAQAARVEPQYTTAANGRPVLLGFDCEGVWIPVPTEAPRQRDAWRGGHLDSMKEARNG